MDDRAEDEPPAGHSWLDPPDSRRKVKTHMDATKLPALEFRIVWLLHVAGISRHNSQLEPSQ